MKCGCGSGVVYFTLQIALIMSHIRQKLKWIWKNKIESSTLEEGSNERRMNEGLRVKSLYQCFNSNYFHYSHSPFIIGYIAMSSVMDIDHTNKQWTVTTVFLYRKNMFNEMK